MNSGNRIFFLILIVLLATGNYSATAQSDKTVSKHAKTDNQKWEKSDISTSRKLISCPVPENIYSDSGTVIVVVRISKRGRITKAQVDKSKSTTENKMLFNNALKAAAYARYSPIDKDTVETGQLTFKFKLK
jgi:TonB family protein